MHVEVDHPLLKHKVTLLRDRRTNRKEFRELATEIALLVAYEALRSLPLDDCEVETPLARALGKRLRHEVVVVPVLRAGVGMLPAMYSLLPDAHVGFVGMYRDPSTKEPIEYYENLPAVDARAAVVVVDPMLATGGSANMTIDRIKSRGFRDVRVISIISAPEGIAAVEAAHPDVRIYTGAVDERLDDHKYIVPGLGDAGDRLFGTT